MVEISPAIGADIVFPTFSVFLNWTLCKSLTLIAIEANGFADTSDLRVDVGVFLGGDPTAKKNK